MKSLSSLRIHQTLPCFIMSAILVFLALCIASPSTSAASVVMDRVVAVVNNEVITLSELQREMTVRKGDARPDEHQALEDIIDRKLQLMTARRNGMEVTDKELADAVSDIMKRNSLSDAQFEAALMREGLTLAQYKTELRDQMTLSRTFGKFVRASVTINEEEVRVYYNRNPSLYSLPDEVRVRHIYIPIPANADPSRIDDLRKQAGVALNRSRSGEDFIRLVREYSPREVAESDGDLGYMQHDHLLPAIAEAIKGLKPGDVAGPIQWGGGLHIIRLEDRRTPTKPFEKVKDEIMNQLYQQKLENTYRAWLQSLRGETNIENKL